MARALCACLLATTLLVWAGAAAALRVEDDAGHVLALARPARRIVSLAPGLTELLFAIGAGPRLVGTVAYSDWPPAARHLPRLGDAFHLDSERLLALRPDLVVIWGSVTPQAQRDRLQQLHLPLFLAEPRHLAEIPGLMQRLGRLAGVADRAAAVARAFSRQVTALRQAHAGARRLRVFYQLGLRPLMTLGGGRIIDDLLALCGGRSVFAGLTAPAAQVSAEAVVAARPDVIVYARDAAQTPAAVTAFWRRRYPPPLPPRVGVPADQVDRAGPRLLQGAEAICRGLDRVRGLRGATPGSPAAGGDPPGHR